MSSPEQPIVENLNLPEFNRRDGDKMALGHTPSTRSAELVAGARAALMNTKETLALSSTSGRVVARFLSDIDGKTQVLWFFPARMMVMEHLTPKLIPADKSELLLVDIASGFSPRALHMAQKYPHAEVVEVDLPDVVAEKKKRLTKGRIEIPGNLRWVEADLGKTPLRDALDGRQADLITSEGLSLYLTHDEYVRLFNNVEDTLLPGGHFMIEMYFKNKLQELRKSPNINGVASFVFRMVGHVPGILPDQSSASKYFTQVGMTDITEYVVADVMGEIGQKKPVDLISIMTARKPLTKAATPPPAEPRADAAPADSQP